MPEMKLVLMRSCWNRPIPLGEGEQLVSKASHSGDHNIGLVKDLPCLNIVNSSCRHKQVRRDHAGMMVQSMYMTVSYLKVEWCSSDFIIWSHKWSPDSATWSRKGHKSRIANWHTQNHWSLRFDWNVTPARDGHISRSAIDFTLLASCLQTNRRESYL